MADTAGADRAPSTLHRNIGVGCFTAVTGLFSGAMIGVLVSKIVAFFSRAPSCSGIPSCDWAQFAMVGGIVGLLTLPSIVLFRLRARTGPSASSDRG